MQRCVLCEAEVPEGGTCCKSGPIQSLDSDMAQVLDENFWDIEITDTDDPTPEPVHEMRTDNGL